MIWSLAYLCISEPSGYAGKYAKKFTEPDDDAFQLNMISTVIWPAVFGGCPQKAHNPSGNVNVINALLECNALCMLTRARHMTKPSEPTTLVALLC